ncbi:MAG: nucleoside monophosphate kinase [Patescibacteria group bacterium]|nr:nucleoside monophosphate kinase [Patescibacteria group bacterium]
MQTYILVGRSGCGKGTQLELLQQKINKPNKTIAMGDIYRAFFKEEGYVRDIARDISVNQGKFQPDFITNSLFVSKALDVIDNKSVLFLEGYPRTSDQFKVVKELMEYTKRNNITVINLYVSAESAKQRLLDRGREDDTEKAIDSRLLEYERTVVPMLEEIKKDSSINYIEIDGEPTVEEIHQDIMSKI